ncbi:AAA family ATPase [Kocuria marina]|uniref:AAA family ATPase n=1 Tax=Kocuria marina TaxID=223184 RepID=UPI0034611564
MSTEALDRWIDQGPGGVDEITPEYQEYARLFAEQKLLARVRRDVKQALAAEDAGATAIPPGVRLDQFLEVPDEDTVYRVDQLWPTGGRVLLAAQYKAGKTTFVANLLRSLVDGDPFLGQFKTEPVQRVALIDNELDERTVRRWLRAQGIRNTQAVHVYPLRGKAGAFNLLDDTVRAQWARELAGVDVVLFDCLRPALDALGLDENHDAGRFLVAFDALLSESGATEATLVHHMGHSGERSRGDSRILDWPDATWKLVREDTENPASPRYFSGFGRDVDHAETALTYHDENRHLTLGSGSRKEAKAAGALEDVLELLDKTPEGLSGRGIKDALSATEWTRVEVESAIRLGRERREIFTRRGPRNSTIHIRNHPPKSGETP